MLNVVFGRHKAPKGYVLDTRVYFSFNKKPSWFEDSFVKKFLKGVDGSEVLFEEAIKDKYGHGISTEMISTGCKTLCDIYYDTKGTCFYGSAMGDNCVPYLVEIARTKEVNIFLEHYMDIPTEVFEEGIVREMYTGRVLGEYDYCDIFDDWVRWTNSLDPYTLEPREDYEY